MRIECRHGYFIFEEFSTGEMARFMSLFEVEIERSGDHFTFADLVDAPDFSIAGGTFLGAPTKVTYEGNPWDVMRANGLVYDFQKGLLVPKLSVIQTVKLQVVTNYIVSNGMIVPGSVTEDGKRITDYAAFFQSPYFRYSEVTGE